MIRLLSIAALFCVVVVVTLHLLFPLPDKIDYSVVITDNKGELIHAFLTHDDKWRMETNLDEISPLLKKTIVQKEDRFFYFHFGINPLAAARAFVNNIFQLKRTSGASTITMQVARALERKPRTYSNKLIEIFRAWQLEMKYNKNEILKLYCNLLPYGGNIEGVKAASLLYFKKDPDHLSLAEITALCIIPNRPSSLVIGKNNEEIIKQRNIWLRRFRNRGIFTEKEIENAIVEPLEATRGQIPKQVPHLALQLKNSGNNFICSSIEMNTQLKVEKIVRDYSKALQLKHINNAAVVILENSTGNVITYVGSQQFGDTMRNGQVNGVTAVRQPGSTLKPFVYGQCIDEGLLTPKAVLADVNLNYGGYAPENYDKQFNGYVTMSHALEHSLNIPAVRALHLLGKDKFISTLSSCNFRQVRKDNKKLGLSLILGGCGATLMELTSLYAALANEGNFIAPSFTLENPSRHRIPVMSKSAAFMINETLSEINRPDFPINWQSTEHMPKIAWKTGTSYGRRDAWSIGYNKRFTVGVWIGNFSGVGTNDLSGAETATPLLFRIFNTLDYDSDDGWFNQPNDCDIRMVCSETGMIPAEHCPAIITDYFIPAVSSTAICNNRKEEIISADERISYCRLCMPAAGYKKKWYRKIDADIQSWMDGKGLTYEHIPPHNPDCEQVFKNGGPKITSPSAGLEYLVSKKNPEPLKLQCVTGNDVETIFWYVNNRFYRSAPAKTPVYFAPEEGPVKISCTDDKGRNRDVWIRVKFAEL